MPTPPPSAFLLCATLLLHGCASGPVYEVPTGAQALADVTVKLPYGSRNFYAAFYVRGQPKCNPVPLVRALQPIVEDLGALVAYATSTVDQHVTRLPAGQPIALRYTYLRVDTLSTWDFVVVLEPGKTYEANLDIRGGVRFVEVATQSEAQRLPHNWFHHMLTCP